MSKLDRINAQIAAARAANDWDLHDQLWEERRSIEVDADESILRDAPANDRRSDDWDSDVHPDDAWNRQFCFDHAERPASEGRYDSEWYWILLCARHASVFRIHEQSIYLDMHWDYLGQATRAGIVFG